MCQGSEAGRKCIFWKNGWNDSGGGGQVGLDHVGPWRWDILFPRQWEACRAFKQKTHVVWAVSQRPCWLGCAYWTSEHRSQETYWEVMVAWSMPLAVEIKSGQIGRLIVRRWKRCDPCVVVPWGLIWSGAQQCSSGFVIMEKGCLRW